MNMYFFSCSNCLQNHAIICIPLPQLNPKRRTGTALKQRRFLPLVPSLFLLFLFICPLAADCQQTSRSLDFYLQAAISNSPLLKDYQNQISSGALDSLLIRAANKPQVLANGQVIVAPLIDGYGYDQAITNGGTYAAMLSVTQPVFTKRILQPEFEASRLSRASIGTHSMLSRLDLERTITQQYLDAYASLAQYQSNLEVYQLYRDQQQLLHDLTAQGLYKETDYLSFLVALQTQEISLGQLSLQFQTGLATLNYLCGIYDTARVILEDPRLEATLPPLRDSSVFFRQFLLDSLTILNGRAQVDARYRPSLNWFANAGLNSSSLSTAYRNFGASAGINLTIPIYDGHQRELQYRKLNFSENTRSGYASFFNRQYDQQTAMLAQQLATTGSLVAQIQSKMDNVKLLTDLDRKLLNTGDVRITDYILALNNYLTISGDLIMARINRWQIINQLNYWHH